MSRLTYEGLAQTIADDVNETIKYEVNLSDGIKSQTVEQMIMDKASEETPDYLDHYDVADKAREYVEFDWCIV